MRSLTAVALFIAFAAGPAWAAGGVSPAVVAPAEPTAPAPGAAANLPKVTSAELVPELYKLCKEVSTAAPTAAKDTEAEGWAEDTRPENSGDGPFFTQYAANKAFAGIGDAALWGTIEYYPTRREGYCRIDFPDAGNIVDFADFAKIPNVTGTTKTVDSDVYGAWQEGATDPQVMIIAQRVGGDFQLEFNTLLPGAPPPGVTDAPASKPAATAPQQTETSK
jgi:hypothetical protein